jgi:MoxR-like ATPase
MDGGMTDIAAIAKDYINLFLIGKPGTGKTKTAYALAAALGLPIYTIAMTKNTEEDVCATRLIVKSYYTYFSLER